MPRTTSRVNQRGQIKASAAAKAARIEEGGLGGPRLGKISARTRKAQARRDAKADAARTSSRSAKGKSAAAAAAAAGPTASSKAAAAKKPAADSKARKHRTSPLIEVRTDSSVEGSAGLDAFVEKVVTGALSRFMPRVTRIDVHLSDANAGKQGDNDKRCQIEVRPAAQQPLSATATAGTIEKALTRAAGKMKRLLAKGLDPRVRA